MLKLIDKLAEAGARVFHQLMRCIIFNNLATIHHQDSIRFHYRVQAVCNCYHSCPVELSLNQLKNLLLSHHIDVSSGFIQYYDLVFPQNGTTDTDQLFFPN